VVKEGGSGLLPLPLPPKDIFEQIEYILFRITLFILFVSGLWRIIKGELRSKRKPKPKNLTWRL
jgi:hypothetical protein